jgi:hypothetical protein
LLSDSRRKEIEEKKQELRRLVGTRYRDLIDSADSIIHMRDLVSQLDAKIHKTEELCNFLKKKRKRDNIEEKKQATQSNDKKGIIKLTFSF